jgi:uncharacterized protein
MFIKKEGIDYICNFYRYSVYDKKKDLILLTSESGSYVFLNTFTFRQLRKGKIVDETSFKALSENDIILHEENILNCIKKLADKYNFLDNGTTLHIVIPTSRCNLACSYCFADPDPINASKDEKDLDEDTALRIIDFIMNSPQRAVTIEFQGGEAVARFDLVLKMAKYARELNKSINKSLKLSMVSNLTLMTDDIAEKLCDNEISLCTSLDGPKIVHDKNRIIQGANGNEIGTYDLVKYWIDRINNLYKRKNLKQRMSAVLTVSAYSLPYYKEIIDEYVSLGLDVISLRSLTHVGKAANKNNSSIFYTFNEFRTFYENSLNYLKELKKKGVDIKEDILSLYETKILDRRPTYHTEFESPCGAATGQITYHSNGDIYTCHEALGREEFKLGNVREDKWGDIFKREETSKAVLNSMLESNPLCDKCVFKPYCATCMVENFYNFSKFNFYPTKTSKHHETIMHSRRIFDDVLRKNRII